MLSLLVVVGLARGRLVINRVRLSSFFSSFIVLIITSASELMMCADSAELLTDPV